LALIQATEKYASLNASSSSGAMSFADVLRQGAPFADIEELGEYCENLVSAANKTLEKQGLTSAVAEKADVLQGLAQLRQAAEELRVLVKAARGFCWRAVVEWLRYTQQYKRAGKIPSAADRIGHLRMLGPSLIQAHTYGYVEVHEKDGFSSTGTKGVAESLTNAANFELDAEPVQLDPYSYDLIKVTDRLIAANACVFVGWEGFSRGRLAKHAVAFDANSVKVGGEMISFTDTALSWFDPNRGEYEGDASELKDFLCRQWGDTFGDKLLRIYQAPIKV
jgi:hypothetical protein